jgi:hypothetical protein
MFRSFSVKLWLYQGMSLCCRILSHETGPLQLTLIRGTSIKNIVFHPVFLEPLILQQLDIIEQFVISENVKFDHSSRNTKFLC